MNIWNVLLVLLLVASVVVSGWIMWAIDSDENLARAIKQIDWARSKLWRH